MRKSAPAHFAALVLALIAMPAAGAVPSFPMKTIRFIFPFAPSSGNDTLSRALTQAMTKNTGWSIVPVNDAGPAGGRVISSKAQPLQ